MQTELTSQQILVVDYLNSTGCEVADRLDGSGYVRFKCLGSDNMAGYVYPSGIVYIFSDHTAPFDKQSVSFFEIMKKARGVGFASRIRSHIEPQIQKMKKQDDVRCELEIEAEEIPTILECISNARCPRKERYSMRTQDVLEWIKSPPKSWFALSHNHTLSDIKTRYTPCVLRSEETQCTLGFLDIDKKENKDARLLKETIERMRGDERVFCIFHSLSGNGYAVGIGIRYTTSEEYEKAMLTAINDFEKDYAGLTIDCTCARFSQLRALSFDENIFVREKARYYRGYTMIQQEIDKEFAKIEYQINDIQERAKKASAELECAPTMLEELDTVYDDLNIQIREDKWTGKREYTIGGIEVKDMNHLYLPMMDRMLKRNSNAYHLKKTELCDYMASRIDVYDNVLQSVFAGSWDKHNRWPQLKAALHLSDFDLKVFKLWMRQGAALLYNKGKATDVQRNFMMILYSRAQHIGKTELVKKLSCGTGSFTQKHMNTNSKDAMMELYSNWIYEYGELGSQFRKTDVNELKSFITDSSVVYRRPYDRDSTVFPVRTSIIGTTNECDLFIDQSGNRRYLVIDCQWTRDDWPAINAIDFIQLWRQARMEWLSGEPIILTLEDQIMNEKRCAQKRVISKEMYIILSVLKQKRSTCAPIAIDKGNEIWVDMRRLLEAVRDQWNDVKVYALTRELEAMGFERVRGTFADVFKIERTSYVQIISSDEYTVRPKGKKE